MFINVIPCWPFNLLNEKTKEKVLNEYGSCKVEDSFWYESELNNYKDDLASVGFLDCEIFFELNPNDCVFKCGSIDLKAMRTVEKATDFVNHDGKHSIIDRVNEKLSQVQKLLNNPRMIEAVDSGNDEASVTYHSNRNSGSAEISFECSLPDSIEEDESEKEKFLILVAQTEEALEELRSLYCELFMHYLSENYDYLTSEASLLEHFEANEWLFDSYGKINQVTPYKMNHDFFDLMSENEVTQDEWEHLEQFILLPEESELDLDKVETAINNLRRNKQCDFFLVALDETEYVVKDFLKEFKIESISCVSLLDKSEETHLCEVTPSYCLHPVYYAIKMCEGASEEDREKAKMAVDRDASFDLTEVSYTHCSDLLKILSKETKEGKERNVYHWSAENEWDDLTASYEEFFEYTLNDCRTSQYL